MTETVAVKTYEGLSEYQKRLFQVLAVGARDIHLSDLSKLMNECASDCGPVETKSGAITQALIKSWGESLAGKGFVSRAGSSSTSVKVANEFIDFGVQRAAREDRLREIAAAVANTIGDEKKGPIYSWHRDPSNQQRRTRVAFYLGDVETYRAELQKLEEQQPSNCDLNLLSPFDAELFERTPDELKAGLLMQGVRKAIETGSGSLTQLEIFDAYAYSQTELTTEFADLWVNLCVARGDIAGLSELASHKKSYSALAAACHAFLTGNYSEAEAGFAAVAKPLGTSSGRKQPLLPDLQGLMQILIYLRKGDESSRATVKSFCARIAKEWRKPLNSCDKLLKAALAYVESPIEKAKTELVSAACSIVSAEEALSCLLAAHVAHWFAPRQNLFASREWAFGLALLRVEKWSEGYSNLGLEWLCALSEDALQVVSHGKNCTTAKGARHEKLGTQPMLHWIKPIEEWRGKLDVLRAIATGKPGKNNVKSNAPDGDERMIWELECNITSNLWRAELRPLLQKVSGKSWTKGRPVALQRLCDDLNNEAFKCLSDQDRAICKCIEAYDEPTGYYRYTEMVYRFDEERMMQALVGHPFVFTPGNREQPIEITSKDPQLVVSRNKNGVRLTLEPRLTGDRKVVVTKDGAQRLNVVVFTDQQRKLAEAIQNALDIPESGVDDVLDVAKRLSLILSVQSDVAFDQAADSASTATSSNKSVTADARPQLHLLPFHAGLRAELFVQPLGDSGPCYVPGEGGANVCANVAGELLSSRRDLRAEVANTKKLVAKCSALADRFDDERFVFEFPTADEALEMLLEVEPMREKQELTVQWPQGQSLRVAGRVDGTQLKVRIARDRDWFSASGELVVDEALKVDMLELLNLVSATPSRFVQLNDGRFIALTEKLRQRVAELAAFGERTKDSFRFPQIRAAALTDLDEWCSLKADKHWKAHLQKIAEAGDVVAEVPSTLDAELRDYQVEGFRWLCRLAHWGAGACLADDMGLGKTLQAIALLLRRAADGPALVVAPTSVCFNWQAELRRFAPTLNPRVFGGGDRDAFFDEVGPRDVVIVSYGLLNSEAERLQATHWHTAILDEAQAIKNMLTKRSQAAMSLTADFRLIMTGTPIENHLGELWNLFQFINPGLLGSIEQYQQRFALPIERDQNREVRQQLKRLVQPFLLRRTKTQVLSELPPRIEVTVPVTLSEEETLLYEAARQRAVEQLSADTDARGKHLRILAELMRLRRACCHPSLLLPDCNLPGSKLAAFTEKIDELIENRHKALVFSQFVDHLSILRAELDRKGVKYQYLDGSTSPAERKRSVDAFQNGEGDVFLISLKAGGVGLNLTAADYVLHMDPWWNPAVEDQAADRAHRMGQLRPVTIYRFITRHTIEEKILELHGTKRDLADSLLEGTDTTGRLSADELLELMR